MRWLLVFALGCGAAATTATPEPAPVGVAAAPRVDELAQVAGDEALFTVVLRLHRWAEIQRTLRSLIGPNPPGDLDRLLSAPSPEALAALESRRLAAGLENLQGLDRERPVVIRIGEAPDDLASAVAVARGSRPSPLRHVVVLPASDPVALRDSLALLFDQQCRRTTEGTLECSGPEPVHIVQDDAWVFLVIGERGDELRTSSAPSAALAWALREQHPVAVFARGATLRGVAAHHGAERLADALANVDPSYADQMRIVGVGELAGAFLRSGPHGREIDEAAIALRESPASFVGIARLTPTGLRRLGAGSGTASSNAPGAWVSIRSSYDLLGAADAADVPHGFRGLGTPGRIAQAVTSCGFYCILQTLTEPVAYGGLLQGFGLLGGAQEVLSIRQDASLGAGSLEVDVDVSAMAQATGDRELREIAASVPSVFLRSRVVGNTWRAALGVDNELPLPDVSLSASDEIGVPSDVLECVEQLGVTVVEGLHDLGSSEPADQMRLGMAVRNSAARYSACAEHSSVAAEVAGYQAALEVLPAP